MASGVVNNYRIEPLRKDNHDTWVIQAQAILIKSGLRGYVTGEKATPNDDAAPDVKAKWMQEDLSARSELLLVISPSELKQVRNCVTSKQAWDTLKGIYQTDGPARKATLLKRLVLHKMKETDDTREHLNAFIDAAKEAMHLQQLISDMGVKHEAIEIFNDNLSAQDLTKNPIVSSRSKHISIREHFIREKVQDGSIIVIYKPSEDMEADILTKGLAEPRHDLLKKAMGLQPKPTE